MEILLLRAEQHRFQLRIQGVVDLCEGVFHVEIRPVPHALDQISGAARAGIVRKESRPQLGFHVRKVFHAFLQHVEALSRGAAAAVFVDRRAEAVRLIEDNLRLCRLEANTQVICGDAMAYLGGVRQPFDLILLDPPYGEDLLERAVAQIARFDLLSPGGIMVAESAADKTLPALSAPYGISREYRYGQIKVTVYRRQPDADKRKIELPR